jgi:hypothetical protein
MEADMTACLSFAAIEQWVIYVIVVVAVIAIIRILIPWLMSLVGGMNANISRIIDIVLWAIVAILVVRIVFGVLACLFR